MQTLPTSMARQGRLPAPAKELLKERTVNAMCRVIPKIGQPITIVPIAALTNIALLLKLYSEVKENLSEIVMMGGLVTRGNKGVMSEFNIGTDPEAAAIVFKSGIPIVIAGQEGAVPSMLTLKEAKGLCTSENHSSSWNCLFGCFSERAV